METNDTISIGKQSSLTDNTNVDNSMSRRRSGSSSTTSTSNNTSNNANGNRQGRKSLSSASSTTSSSSICSRVSVESNGSVRSSNRRRNTLVPGANLNNTQGIALFNFKFLFFYSNKKKMIRKHFLVEKNVSLF